MPSNVDESLAGLQVGSFGAVHLGCMLNSIEQIDFRLHQETANRACCMLLENPWITPQSKKQLLPRFNDFAELLLQSCTSLSRFNDSAYLPSVNVEHYYQRGLVNIERDHFRWRWGNSPFGGMA